MKDWISPFNVTEAHLRDFLARPLKIRAHLFGVLETLLEPRS